MTSGAALPVPAPRTVSIPTRARYDAIVVGTGIGGSVTAALLARAGRSVLVLEKNDRVGGILAGYQKHGFHLDHGSHLVACGDRGALGAVLRDLGLREPRLLTHRVPVRSRGMFPIAAPRTRLGLPLKALEAAIKLKIPPRDALGLARMLWTTFTLRGPALDALDEVTLEDFIHRYTEHPAAYFLFGFLASIFYVLPPWEVSAGEALRGLRDVLGAYRLSYVQGGMEQIPFALLHEVPRAGGEIVVGARVTGIERASDDWHVTTEDGRAFTARAVAANLAPEDLLRLTPAVAWPEAWVERVRAIVPSGNAHQLKIALDRPLVREGCLIGGLTREGLTLADLSRDLMVRTVTDIAGGRITDPLAVYAPVPSNYDPTLAPPGQQLLVASFYGPTTSDPVDGPDAWREAAIDALASVVPGLRDHLLFADFLPVPAVGRWMGKRSASAICNGQTPGQVGAARLPVTTPLPGLLLCGDGAGGRGIGMELAATSAREAVRAALEHLG